MDRARSLPPVALNPWWSDKVKREAILRSKRPEDLPVPADGDLEDEVEAVQDGSTACSGKGRGVTSLGGSVGARLFTTPPSARSEIDGRPSGRGKQTDGIMPPSESSSGPSSHGRASMGPLPPKHRPPREPDREKEDQDSLQRALEAEMVQFLREQNTQLWDELERLKKHQSKSGSAPTSTPSSWVQIDGLGGGQPAEEASLGSTTSVGDGGGPVRPMAKKGEPPRTPRGRSPTNRRPAAGGHRFTPNGTQVPPGSPPDRAALLEIPAPPFPPSSNSADLSLLTGYELLDRRGRHGDSQWLPMDQREGKAFVPQDRTSQLEREVEELKNSLAYMKENVPGITTSCSKEVPPAPRCLPGGSMGMHGHDLRGMVHGHGGELNFHRAPQACDRVCPPDPGTGLHGDVWRPVRSEAMGMSRPGAGGPGLGSEPRDDEIYGRWRPESGSSMAAPLPWHDGSGSKADLPTLAADASPIELGDWLAVCGPVLRDLSQVSARWWNLTLREAQCYYDRWKTASPLERVQLDPKLPDELFDVRYQRTEQRGVHLLLKAIPGDQQQALITARELTSTALLFRLLVRYQPGGAGEKSILLAKLTALDKAAGLPELAATLRTWRRHYARAEEIGAVLPDGTLLLKALEPAVTQIAALDAQAAFRLAQSRLQLGVDQQPHHAGVWRFSQCLLAEVETLTLLNSTPTTSATPVKVKQLDAPGKQQGAASAGDKGKGTSTAALPCRYFRSDTGCKAGKNCKWSHAWDGIDDKAQRCWICGGKDHRKSDCKLKSQTTGKPSPTKDGKGAGEPSAGSGGGKMQSGSRSSGGQQAAQNPVKLQEMEIPGPETAYATGAGDNQSGETMTKGGETGATTSEALLHEATQLLKSLRAPQLRVIRVSQLDYDTSGSTVLLDSGATHALRPAADMVEWEAAQPTQVTLAEGVSNKLRLKQDSKVLLSAPHDAELDKSWIVPLGGIAELGYRFEWKGSYCLLKDDHGNKLHVTIQHGCPMVNKELGRQMIDRLERRQVHLAQKALLIKTLFAQPSMVPMAPPLSTEMALTLKLKHLLQDAPDELLMKVIPDLSDLQQVADGSLLPWNRRKRRRLAQAKQIVLHLFSGPDARYWEKALQQNGVEVLCVDLQAAVAADMHDDNVYRFLLALAATGRVKAIVGGPPCRTVSALRYQDDDGPGVLRSEEHPYGLPSLSMAEQALVWGDSILLFRMLALYVLCEDVRHEHEPQTALALEQPEDPARYRPREEVEKKKFMSIWRTKAWRVFSDTYQIRLLHFDQGPMGHVRKKPTTLAVKLRDIHALNEIRGPPCGDEEAALDRRGMPLRDRCDQSKQWAAWAPGLKVALVLALQDHLNRGIAPALETALRPLGQVALESWRQHYPG